jgi:hypothetical protein
MIAFSGAVRFVHVESVPVCTALLSAVSPTLVFSCMLAEVVAEPPKKEFAPTHTHTRARTHTHTYVHTYTHTHTHRQHS